MTNDLHNVDHMYIPMNQNSEPDNSHELLQQQICTLQSDMKQLVTRIQYAEQKITILTQERPKVADTDIVSLQSDMKQLVTKIENAEQKIAVLTQQQADMADADMVIIRS